MNIELLPSALVAVFGILLGIGGALAMRQGYAKRLAEIQTAIIDALKLEVQALEKQIAASKVELDRCNAAISTIKYALEKEGKILVVNGSFITVSDVAAKRIVKIEMHPVDEKEQ